MADAGMPVAAGRCRALRFLLTCVQACANLIADQQQS
jgi:hypothetical protein